jgi:hypothetical protein
MFMKAKDAASFAGLAVVGAVALLLAFGPLLVEKGEVTLLHLVWASCALTFVSVIFFGVEKYLNSKDEQDRRKKDDDRDAILKRLLEEREKGSAAQRTVTPQRAVDLEQAHTLYAALETTANKPPAEAANLMREALKLAASKATTKQLYVWDDITAMLKRQITGNQKDREDLRKAADSLVWSAVELPEKNRR